MVRIDPGQSKEEREQSSKEMRARFDELGPVQVKHLISIDGLPHHWTAAAAEWLAEKEKQS